MEGGGGSKRKKVRGEFYNKGKKLLTKEKREGEKVEKDAQNIRVSGDFPGSPVARTP